MIGKKMSSNGNSRPTSGKASPVLSGSPRNSVSNKNDGEAIGGTVFQMAALEEATKEVATAN